MFINSLFLKNFRNYNEQYLEFDKNINIFHGNNGQGKTNILEAIYILSTSKSHRGANDDNIIKFDQEEAYIKTAYTKNSNSYTIDINFLRKRNKNIRLNGLKINKISEIVGNLNVVMFSPDDINFIKQGPTYRRKILDILICQLKPIYLYNLSYYKKLISHRNILLKENNVELIKIYDEKISEYAIKIEKERKTFVEKINFYIEKTYRKISNTNSSLKVIYTSSLPDNKEDYIKLLSSNLQKDLKYKSTTNGPHREDLIFLLDNKDILDFGSQGQVRSLVLCFKLTELDIIKDYINEYPILLLDDVLSELDHIRREQLFLYIKNIQTFITTTDIDIIKEKSYKSFKIENGNVI